MGAMAMMGSPWDPVPLPWDPVPLPTLAASPVPPFAASMWPFSGSMMPPQARPHCDCFRISNGNECTPPPRRVALSSFSVTSRTLYSVCTIGFRWPGLSYPQPSSAIPSHPHPSPATPSHP